MAVKERRSYDREFKVEAVRLLLEDERSANELGEDLGVHQTLLHKWKRQYLSDTSTAFPGSGRLAGDQDELQRLRRELAAVKEERDILKKAVGIFSHPRR